MLTARAIWKYLLLLSKFPDIPSALAKESSMDMRASAMSFISRLDILRLAKTALPLDTSTGGTIKQFSLDQRSN
jgi:hypothetical protein